MVCVHVFLFFYDSQNKPCENSGPLQNFFKYLYFGNKTQ